MRILLAALILGVCSSVLVPIDMTAAAESLKKKPQAPVHISIRPADVHLSPASIKPGDEVSMEAVVMSSLDDPEMRITLSMSGGTRFLSGDLSWSGPSVKGETTTVYFVVRAPMDGKGKVRALVEIGPKRAGQITSRAEYEFGVPEKQKPQEPRDRKKDSKGRGVVEYR